MRPSQQMPLVTKNLPSWSGVALYGRRGLRLEIGIEGVTQRLQDPVAEAMGRLKRQAKLYQRLARMADGRR